MIFLQYNHWLYPFWNHWWSLQSDWLSQCDLFTNHTIFSLNHICSKSRHSCSKLHYSCFKSHHFCSISLHFCFEFKVRCKKPLCFRFSTNRLLDQYNIGTDWILPFQNSSKVVIEPCVVQFWSEIILAILNRTRARPILKSRVWFQTKLHSTQLNYHYKLQWRSLPLN